MHQSNGSTLRQYYDGKCSSWFRLIRLWGAEGVMHVAPHLLNIECSVHPCLNVQPLEKHAGQCLPDCNAWVPRSICAHLQGGLAIQYSRHIGLHAFLMPKDLQEVYHVICDMYTWLTLLHVQIGGCGWSSCTTSEASRQYDDWFCIVSAFHLFMNWWMHGQCNWLSHQVMNNGNPSITPAEAISKLMQQATFTSVSAWISIVIQDQPDLVACCLVSSLPV